MRPLSRRRFLKLTALSAAGTAAGGARYAHDSNVLEVTRTAIELPGAGPDFTLAFLADVHAPQPRLDFDAVIQLANASQPDLVVIVGDAINRRGDAGLVEMYGPLQAKLGKYSTVGNWENWALVHRPALAAHYERAGVRFLDNAVVGLDGLNVNLVGLDERMNGRPDWSLLAAAPADRLTLLLHHSPGAFDLLPVPPGATVLMLAGHSHGGQIAPFGRPIVLPPGCRGYASGRYDRGPHRLYVTRGIGNSHIPFRIGPRPELAILEVRRVG